MTVNQKQSNSEYLPFEDELTYKFYKSLPDFTRFKEKENSEEAQ